MAAQDCLWDTIETAEAFWHLTALPALAALMVHYPSLVYEDERVEAFLRVLCLAARIDTEDVNWSQLTATVVKWAQKHSFDVVEERA